MNKKLIKWIGLIGLICSFATLFLAHPLPSGPSSFKGTPAAQQILIENTGSTDVTISSEIIKNVIEDVQTQRAHYKSALRTSLFFNFVSVAAFALIIFSVGVGSKNSDDVE